MRRKSQFVDWGPAGCIIVLSAVMWIAILEARLARVGKGAMLDKSALAAESLAYLDDIPGVLWHRLDKNRVLVVFTVPLPDDWELITRAAALDGHRATGTTFYSSSVPDSPEFEPHDRRGGYSWFTARGGKVTRNSIRRWRALNHPCAN